MAESIKDRESRRDQSTCYIGVEANPLYDAKLHMIERQLQSHGRPTLIYASTAFNVHNDHATLYAEYPGRPFSTNVSSTLSSDKGYYRKEMVRGKVQVTPVAGDVVENHYVKINVSSLNAGQFLARVVASSGFVGIKNMLIAAKT